MNKLNTCYRCGGIATSKEHVPPLCFFPEKKDIKYLDLRINLITVPSCDEHNLHKSKDDEFLLACLTGIVGNNIIGYIHNKTKVRRALDRKGLHFIKSIFKESEEFLIKTTNGEFPVIQGSPNYHRMVNCFEYIAYGLYYNEFKKVFDGECKMIFGFLSYHDENSEKLKILIQRKHAIEAKNQKYKGTNPSVFKYQFSAPDEFDIISLKIVFYEGTTVYIAFKPSGKQIPFNLGFEFIKRGIKTFVKINDDESIEFN